MVTWIPKRSLLRIRVRMKASLCFTDILAEPKTLAERGAYAAIAEATLWAVFLCVSPWGDAAT